MTADHADAILHTLNALVVLAKLGVFALGAVLGVLAGDFS